jgi:hypothetical protein
LALRWRISNWSCTASAKNAKRNQFQLENDKQLFPISQNRVSSNPIQNILAPASGDPYQQTLASTRIIPEMDGQAIRIPDFIVPLEFNDKQTITQFYLVPFFGACIHLPPPPPNQIIFVNYPEGLMLQIIFVNYPEGLMLNTLYDPFWISAILKTSLTENAAASAVSCSSYHTSQQLNFQ